MIKIQSKFFLIHEPKYFIREHLLFFQVEQTRITLRESGVQLNLSCVDTPGFGDEVNNDKCWDPVIEFIEQQFELYLNAESRVEYGFGRKKIIKSFFSHFFCCIVSLFRKSVPDRPAKIPDTRVHCCLYFIAPSGHGLKPIDIEFMRRLHDKVFNILISILLLL